MVRIAPFAAALAALALAAPVQAAAPPLRGAATHPLYSGSVAADSTRELDALVAAHATAVRVDFSWASLESGGKGVRSQWLIDKMDALVAAARARNLAVLVTFWGTPCWASSAPADAKQSCAGAWWDPSRAVDRYPPTDPDDLADAAAWAAARWGDDIAALEIWNEPNLNIFLRTSTPAPVYAAMLKASYPAVKAAAPSLTVLAPGMLNSDTAFLTALYDQGIQGYFDGISSHPFQQQYSPYVGEPAIAKKFSYVEGIPAVRDVMVAHGDGDKKMWLTELGWSSCKPDGTSSWCVTREQQAQYVGDALRIARDRWDYVRGLFVYTLRGTGSNLADRESQMGLLLQDFTPKPAYDSFASALADLAANPLPPAPPPPPDPPPPPPPPPPAPPEPEQQQQSEIVAAPPPDLAAPRLSLLRVAPAAVRAGRRVVVSWTLDEGATVTFSLERLVRARCGLSRRVCSRWSRARTMLTRAAPAGPNAVKLSARLRGRKLRAGRYRLAAVSTDVAGNHALPVRAALRVR